MQRDSLKEGIDYARVVLGTMASCGAVLFCGGRGRCLDACPTVHPTEHVRSIWAAGGPLVIV